MARQKILIVEDECIIAKDIEKLLLDNGYAVSGIAANAKDAFKLIDKNKPDLILLDVILNGDIDGIEIASFVQAKQNIPIIYLTAYSDIDTITRIKSTSPYGYLIKPFEEKELLLNLDIALSRKTTTDKENLESISKILENINDCVIITDITGNIKYINTAAEKELSIKLYNNFGKNINKIFKISDLSKTQLVKYNNSILKFRNLLGDDHYNRERVYIFENTENDKYNYFNNAALSHLNEVIIIFDNEFRIKYASRNAKTKLGYDSGELLDKSIFDIIEKEELSNFLNIIKGKEISENEIKFIKKTGTEIFFDIYPGIIYDIDGAKLYMVSLHDISQWKKAENDLKELTKRLSISNKELEQFAYIASHDMQEPLRMIASYVQLIKKRYINQLDKDAEEYIEFAVDGVNRLKYLINDLLTYSRLTLSQIPFKEIDCNLLISEIEEELRYQITNCSAVIVYDKLPIIYGDTSQIKQLFKHLIINSLKFKSDIPPRIIISNELIDGNIIFCVKDNGIGIDPAFKEKIFMIFQKLHNYKEYPGTGIGLAICKKIVENHKGRIWFNSESGKGSSFYFAIPKNYNG